MTKQDAIEYLELVLDNWNNWQQHHNKLARAIEVIVEAEKREQNRTQDTR